MKLSALIKYAADSIMRKFFKSLAITLLFSFALVLIAMCIIPNRIYADIYHTLNRALKTDVYETGSIHIKEYKETCVDFIKNLKNVQGIQSVGTAMEDELDKNLVPELYQIQDGHVPNRDTADDGAIPFMEQGFAVISLRSTWELFDFHLAKGSYIPNDDPNNTSVWHLYLGSAYSHIPVGTEYREEDGDIVKVMGILEKGSVCTTDSMLDAEFNSAKTVTLDYMAVLVGNSNAEGFYSEHLFSVGNPADMQPVINRIYDLAKQYELDVTVGTVDGMLKEEQKVYQKISDMLLELMLIVLLVAATIQACVQIVDMIGHFPMYGVLYANGASKQDLCVLILLENGMRYAAACAIAYGVVRLLLFGLFREAELLETVMRIFYRETAVWMCLIGLGVCLLSMAVPLLMIQRKTPVELVGSRL